AAAPAPATAPASTPVNPTVPAQLAEHVERVADIVRLSNAHGVARARLNLHPDDLGSVDVRLRSTALGLVATISVDRAQTLQAVTRAGAELQQQLADRGLTVLRLDVSLADGGATARDTAGQAGAREDRRAPDGTRTPGRRDTAGARIQGTPDLDPTPEPAPPAVRRDGTVDVRA
ncbi:MAG: flagellar hook-length control protein FliK, partial [Solirubrobacterales bacterium]|nr:flagellar hook-length control protein FliK [Solirubrobacterales bacterium]